MIETAVFPIPNCVVFPGTVFPLHVFEPRYRNMIHHCLENDFPLAVAHTQKVLSEGKTARDLEQALKSNQATYKPHPICSSGKCELLQEMKDGRLYINLHAQQRVELIEEKQTLPFSIVYCRPYSDETDTGYEEAAIEILKDKVHHRLIALTRKEPELHSLLQSEEWQHKSSVDFSFQVFQFLRMDPDLQQSILEMRSPGPRLQTLLDILNQSP